MSSKLDQLKAMTLVVADSGDVAHPHHVGQGFTGVGLGARRWLTLRASQTRDQHLVPVVLMRSP